MAKEEKLRQTGKQITTRRKKEVKPQAKAKAKATKVVVKKPPKANAAGPPDASSPQASIADGEQSLLDSVNRVVAANSTKIAEKLAEKAKNGNISSAKLLANLVTIE